MNLSTLSDNELVQMHEQIQRNIDIMNNRQMAIKILS
jgi:hypothetical protein